MTDINSSSDIKFIGSGHKDMTSFGHQDCSSSDNNMTKPPFMKDQDMSRLQIINHSDFDRRDSSDAKSIHDCQVGNVKHGFISNDTRSEPKSNNQSPLNQISSPNVPNDSQRRSLFNSRMIQCTNMYPQLKFLSMDSSRGSLTDTMNVSTMNSIQGKKKVDRDSQWMIQYNSLKAYYLEHGHSNVPMHFATNKRLGHWINNQRQLYRKYRAGLKSSMTEKRIQLLETLDFAWVLGKDWKHKKEKKCKSETKQDEDISIKELESSAPHFPTTTNADNSATNQNNSFKTEMNVPFRKRHHYVKSQLSNYNSTSPTSLVDTHNITKDDVASEQNTLTLQNIKTFDDNTSSLAMPTFSSPSRLPAIDDRTSNVGKSVSSLPNCINSSDKQWLNHLDDLMKFKEIHGHCDVPFQHHENKSLGYWVHNQRQVYKKWLKGESCSLTQSRIDSLEELGFRLNSPRKRKADAQQETIIKRKQVMNDSNTSIKTNSKNIDKPIASEDITQNEVKSKVKIEVFDVLWNRRLSELQNFYLNNGHSDVPAMYPANKPLGIWAMNQRQQYRKLKNGETSSLTPERILALEILNFRWYLGRGVRGKDSNMRALNSKEKTAAVVLLNLRKPPQCHSFQPAVRAESKFAGMSNWQCHKCAKVNSAKSKRCKCNAWKGGKRDFTFKHKFQTSARDESKFAGMSEWQCHKCAKVNSAKSKRCKCNAWKGGKRDFNVARRQVE